MTILHSKKILSLLDTVQCIIDKVSSYAKQTILMNTHNIRTLHKVHSSSTSKIESITADKFSSNYTFVNKYQCQCFN